MLYDLVTYKFSMSGELSSLKLQAVKVAELAQEIIKPDPKLVVIHWLVSHGSFISIRWFDQKRSI